MFRLLIADDESWIVEGLKVIIDWRAEGFELVAAAQNGNEALNALLKLRPDLALIDIRMPGMDGLDVIRYARSAGIDSVFIIISGYAEFEYAKRGIELSVFDYVLKPLDEDKLLGAVRRASDSLAHRAEGAPIQASAGAPQSPAEYIAAHYADNLSFEVLCRRFNRSASTVRQSILAETGKSFTAYITGLRMKKARALLCDTELSVNDIAVACGYDDALYFRKVFKRNTGQTPTDYRLHCDAGNGG